MDLSTSPCGAPAQSDPLDATDATDDVFMPNRTADATAPRYAGPSPPHGSPLVAPDNAYYRWNTPYEPNYHAQSYYGRLQPRNINLQNSAFLYSEHHPSTPPLPQFSLDSANGWHRQGYEAEPGPLYTLPHRPINLASPRFYHEPHFSSDAGDHYSFWNGRSSINELPRYSDYGNEQDYLSRRQSNLLYSPGQHDPHGLPFRPPSSYEIESHPLVHGLEVSQKPAVQYWPTGNLGTQRRKSTPSQPQRRPSEGIHQPKRSIPAHLQMVPIGDIHEPKLPIPAHLQRPPGQGVHDFGPPVPAHLQHLSLPPRRRGRTGLDKKTRQKQEAFTKRAEARRQSEQLNSGKRPFAHRNKSDSPAAMPAKPAKRLKVYPFDAEPAVDNSQYHGCALSSVSEYDPHQISIHTQHAVTRAPDWDNLCQPIVLRYEDYNWSVQHFELSSVKSGYDFAQSWLEGVYARQLNFNTVYKWYSHVGKGFIKDGGPLSILVLHNATNPFRSGADSSTSIGVYGRHWHEHNEIHWTTIAPGIRGLLDMCEKSQFIREKQKWKVDMAKASDRRFHRAYWLAANCLELGNLLNHGSSEDKAHDLVDDDEAITFTEADVGNKWDVGAEESAAAWAVVLRLNEEVPEPPVQGWDYVVTGSSE